MSVIEPLPDLWTKILRRFLLTTIDSLASLTVVLVALWLTKYVALSLTSVGPSSVYYPSQNSEAFELCDHFIQYSILILNLCKLTFSSTLNNKLF